MARTKLIILVLSVQLLVKHASAQWQIIPAATSNGYNSSIAYISDSTGFLDGCSEPSAWNTISLLKTTDKGNSWQSIKATTGGGCQIVNSFANENTGYCIVTYGTNQAIDFLKTSDGGTTWTEPDTTGNFSLGTTFTGALYFVNSTLGFVAKDNTIYKTANGGKSWQIVNLNFSVRCFFFTSVQTGYAAGDNLIVKTTDGGNTWNIVTSSYSIHSVFFPSVNIGYAVGANGTILKSTDAGSTWFSQVPGISNSIALNSIFCPNNNTCYSVGSNGTILNTTNGGSTWTSQNSGVSVALKSISCTNEHCFAVGDTGVILKTTGSITGIKIGSEVTGETRVFPNPFSMEATIKMSTAFKSSVISMCNIFGQEIRKIEPVSSEEFKIYRGDLKSGIYLLRLTQDNNVISITKLIIVD